MKNKLRHNKGFTLIEIMIAVVVFSFGLLGIAGVMTVAVKNNHNGYQRSQATFLVSSMLDMMRRNTRGLWQDDYDGEFSGYTDVSSMCNSSECNPKQLADRDVAYWGSMISQLLPDSSGTINCVPNGPLLWSQPLSNSQEALEPFSGYCEIEVTWNETDEAGASLEGGFVEWKGKP